MGGSVAQMRVVSRAVKQANRKKWIQGALALLVVIAAIVAGLAVWQSSKDPCRGAEMQEPITEKYARQVMADHTPRLFSQPNFVGAGVNYFEGSSNLARPSSPDAEGKWGILVEVVGKKIDQSTLPEEDRIPDCMDGVPIRWQEDGELALPAPWGDE